MKSTEEELAIINLFLRDKKPRKDLELVQMLSHNKPFKDLTKHKSYKIRQELRKLVLMGRIKVETNSLCHRFYSLVDWDKEFNQSLKPVLSTVDKLQPILVMIDADLKIKFFNKARSNSLTAAYVLREMIKNYLSLGGFETDLEIKTKQTELVKALQALGVK